MINKIFDKLYFLQGVRDFSAYVRDDSEENKQYNIKLRDLEITAVSDCIIISAPITTNSLNIIWSSIHSISSNLRSISEESKDLIIRGAITIGNITHIGNIVFGTGYLKALKLEKEAKYPIILIDKTIIEEKAFEDSLKILTNEYWEKSEEHPGLYQWQPFREITTSLQRREKLVKSRGWIPVEGPENNLIEWRHIISTALSTELSKSTLKQEQGIVDKWIYLKDRFNQCLKEAGIFLLKRIDEIK